jgi:hypothetical protein
LIISTYYIVITIFRNKKKEMNKKRNYKMNKRLQINESKALSYSN